MKRVLSHWPLLFAIFVGFLLILSSVLSSNPSIEPLFPSTNMGVSQAEIVDARKVIGETLIHEEEHLFTVLGLQMGLVAFAATMVFGKEFQQQRPRELFAILIVLTIILGLVYLHLYKGFLGAYAYAVQLESALPTGLRTYQRVYQHLAEPDAPWLLQPIISLTNTFYVVSFLPVYVVLIASVGFGRKLNISPFTIWAINVVVATWAIAYLLPVFRTIAAVGG